MGKATAVQRKRKQRFQVTLGGTTIIVEHGPQGASPTGVQQSSQVLEQLGKKMRKPGIKLRVRKGVPRYSADENNPDLFIRLLDGKKDVGHFENGSFVVVK